MTPLDILAYTVRLTGVALAIPGLWFLAGGLRVVVSGRMDERRRAAKSIKRGAVLSIMAGIVVRWNLARELDDRIG